MARNTRVTLTVQGQHDHANANVNLSNWQGDFYMKAQDTVLNFTEWTVTELALAYTDLAAYDIPVGQVATVRFLAIVAKLGTDWTWGANEPAVDDHLFKLIGSTTAGLLNQTGSSAGDSIPAARFNDFLALTGYQVTTGNLDLQMVDCGQTAGTIYVTVYVAGDPS